MALHTLVWECSLTVGSLRKTWTLIIVCGDLTWCFEVCPCICSTSFQVCVGFQFPSVTCSASKVASPPGGRFPSGLGCGHMVSHSSCFLFLSSDTCHLLLREPTPSLSLSLAPSFAVFMSSSHFTLHQVGKLVGTTSQMLGNFGKVLTSSVLHCQQTLNRFWGKNLAAVATSLPIQTQYTQLVKSRKCLSLRNRVKLNCSILLFGSVIVELSPSMLYWVCRVCVFTLMSSRNLTIHIKEVFVLSDLLHVYAAVWRQECNRAAFFLKSHWRRRSLEIAWILQFSILISGNWYTMVVFSSGPCWQPEV